MNRSNIALAKYHKHLQDRTAMNLARSVVSGESTVADVAYWFGCSQQAAHRVVERGLGLLEESDAQRNV